MTEPTTPHFTDPAAVARYAEGPRRNVPGYDGLLRMSRILLAERVPAQGRVLVVGAGGGLEPVGPGASTAKTGPSEDSFCRVCSPIARLWGKKTVKNGPLRPVCSRRLQARQAPKAGRHGAGAPRLAL